MVEQKYTDRIEKLRNEMRKQEIYIYLIPMNDDHGSEYIAEHFKQIKYYSGFSGSAGTLVVTREDILLWTDGRYFLQAEQELLKSGTKLMKMGEKNVPSVMEFIVSYLEKETKKLSENNKKVKIGFDGSLICFAYVEALQETWKKSVSECELTICSDQDISGKIWEEDETDPRPELEQKKIWIVKKEYCGKTAEEKLADIRKELEHEKQDMLVLSALDEIAWVLNLRGDDIAYNPVFYSYMIIGKDDAVIYAMDVSEKIQSYLSEIGVSLRPYSSFYQDIKQIDNKRILVDERSSHFLLVSTVQKANRIKRAATPVYKKKAVKNETEIANIKKAHILDGVAVTRFIYWLKTKVRTSEEAATEMSAAEKLESYRRMGEGYLGPSFAPIMAYGIHGAIVHYEADEVSDAPIQNNSFLLSDTGGHYLTGTTDITRTIAMGELTKEQKAHYTAVLKGNLRLMDCIFKKGMQGCHLDYVARQPLYEMGLDFNHGTGHGVGYLLNVHEGPNAFRQKPDSDNVLQAGMVTSDEPGFYLAGKYGIRLENLILCVEKEETAYGTFLGFEPLTLVPFDLKAIDLEMMNDTDKKLLDTYHKKVWDAISPYFNQEEKEWLKSQVRPITDADEP